MRAVCRRIFRQWDALLRRLDSVAVELFDIIWLDLDMSPHYSAGERELDAKVSVYRGWAIFLFVGASIRMCIANL